VSEHLEEVLEDFAQERFGSQADQTFRAVMEAKLEGLERRLGRVEARQDATMLLILGAMVGQLALTLLGAG